jgi:hypothetical protein
VTSGSLAVVDELGGRQVPKKDLVGTLQLLFQDRRLKLSNELEHAAIFLTELQHFRLKAVSLTPDAVFDWRERPHDDVVLAVAVAAWRAERGTFKVDVWVYPKDPPPEPRRWWSHW